MIGEISGLAEAKPVDGLPAVQQTDGDKLLSEQLERFAVQRMRFEVRNGRLLFIVVENILEAPLDGAHGSAEAKMGILVRWRKLKGRTSSRPIMWSACE